MAGACGGAQWDEAAQAWRLRYFRPQDAPPRAVEPGLAAGGRLYQDEQLPWREELFSADPFPEPDFYDAAGRWFARGETPPVTPAESRQLLTLIERCRASAASGAVA